MAFGISAGTYLAGGAMLGSAALGASASKSAAKTQANAAAQASAIQQQQYAQQRADQMPWVNYGGQGLNELGFRLGVLPSLGADDTAGQAIQAAQRQNPEFGSLLRNFGAADFQADPGYDFRLSEGMKGINNSAAARGGVLSGAALKAASKYNQNFASNEYGNAYNRFNTDKTNTFNRLASIAGVGQTATNQVGAAGQNMANNVSQNTLSAGNARASGYVGGANALTGAIGQGVNSYMQYNAMQNPAGNAAGYNALGTSGPVGGTAADPWFG